ncbi:nicotinamide riboside transporter PnuC [Chitinophaga defluvii]|uniref:Nicotinamide riboside transporter PnuC n=1 Tax=Chitinophaga defluvii TaxID=3163343 RepID=A0ABV2T874_9BACT
MNFEELYQGLQQGIHHMTWLEAIAVLFGLLSVIFSKQNSVWLYPTGIISTGIYTYMLSQENFKLYAESGLNAYYFIMSVYGWYYWTRKDKQQHETPVSHTNRQELLIAGLIALIGWTIIYTVLRHFSDSNVPVLDAFVSATACSGMWLLAKRKIENWILLNISNFVAVPLLFYKHLYLTGCLTIVLFIIAIFGYFNWKKVFRAQEQRRINGAAA